MTATGTLVQRLTTHQTGEEEEVDGDGDDLDRIHRPDDGFKGQDIDCQDINRKSSSLSLL